MSNRFHGTLLGTVVGDALGRPFEGTARGDRSRLRRAVIDRVQTPIAWSYSDDAEMMLNLGDSLPRSGGVDEADLLQTLARHHEPARGYGKGTRAAFRTWETTRSWVLAARALWPEGSRGNGAAVRVAPIAIQLRASESSEVAAAAARSATTTHAHPEAVQGAALMAMAIHALLRGEWLMTFLTSAHVLRTVPLFAPALARLPSCDDDDAALDAFGHGVFAIESVPLALWVHSQSESFQGALIRAVCLGGDTDTIAAMVGALGGAAHGDDGIPDEWVSALDEPTRCRTAGLGAKLVAGG